MAEVIGIYFSSMDEAKRNLIREREACKDTKNRLNSAISKLQVNSVSGRLRQTQDAIREQVNRTNRRMDNIDRLISGVDYSVRRFHEVDDNCAKRIKGLVSDYEKKNKKLSPVKKVGKFTHSLMDEGKDAWDKLGNTFGDIKKSFHGEFKVLKLDSAELKKDIEKFTEETFNETEQKWGKFEKDWSEAWEVAKMRDPILSGITAGSVEVLKSLTVDVVAGVFNQVHGLIEHPMKQLEEYKTIKSVLLPQTPKERILAEKVYMGIWKQVKADFQKDIINGNAYTRAKYITKVSGTIASFFVGAGEAKAAQTGVEVSEVSSKTLEGINIANKVEDIAKGERKIGTVTNTAEKVSVIIKRAETGIKESEIASNASKGIGKINIAEDVIKKEKEIGAVTNTAEKVSVITKGTETGIKESEIASNASKDIDTINKAEDVAENEKEIGTVSAKIDDAGNGIKGGGNAVEDSIDGIKIIDGKVGGKIPVDEFKNIRIKSIQNVNSDTMTLGKYKPTVKPDGSLDWTTPGNDSYTIMAGDTTYFSLGDDWGVIKNKYNITDDDMFALFNVPALDDAAKAGKEIRFSHDPTAYGDCALKEEWQYLKDKFGYTRLKKIGDFWYAR